VDEKFCHFASSACALFPPNTRTVLSPKGDLGAAIAAAMRASVEALLLRVGAGFDAYVLSSTFFCCAPEWSIVRVATSKVGRWLSGKTAGDGCGVLSAEGAGLNTRKPSTVRRSRRRMTVRNGWCQVEAKHHWQSTA
jgi:hypothetical protein